MYCVIQKVVNKKVNSYGEGKELNVDSFTHTIDGASKRKYTYKYTGKFERTIKDAYKISIHESYRENGKVKKRQWVICTIGYYDIIDGLTWIGDHTINLKDKLVEIGISEGRLCELVYKKLDPIIEKIKSEFETTDEYKTSEKNKKIISKYMKDKEEFEEKYGSKTYDYCYDVFGVLRNGEYLNELEATYKAQQQYKSSYYDDTYGNYNFNDYDSSSFFKTFSTGLNLRDNEKILAEELIKAGYKALAKKYHPDVGGTKEQFQKLGEVKDKFIEVI